MGRRPVRVIADDLTGAADAGVALRAIGPVVLTLGGADARWDDPSIPVVAGDTGTREATAAAAAAATGSLARRVPDGAEVFKKVDSALRGHIAAEVGALREVWPDRAVLLAPAFPRNGRTTRAGVQHIDGIPIHRGDHWALEAAAAPDSLPRLLAPHASHVIALEVVRGPLAGLARAIDAAAEAGRVAICDAEADADLARIVAGGLACQAAVVWVGSAGLASAVARALPAGQGRGAEVRAGRRILRSGPYLAVVGSAAPVARRQAMALAASGRASLVELPAALLESGRPGAISAMAGEVLAAVGGGDTVVTVRGAVEPSWAAAITASLARVAVPAAGAAGALLLTGGATARAVLDACGVGSLDLVAELDPGIVLARPADGAPVPIVTKSGAFGDDRTLCRAVQQITPEEGPTSGGT